MFSNLDNDTGFDINYGNIIDSSNSVVPVPGGCNSDKTNTTADNYCSNVQYMLLFGGHSKSPQM